MGVDKAGNSGDVQRAGLVGRTGSGIRQHRIVGIRKELELLIERLAVFGRQGFAIGPLEQRDAQFPLQKREGFAGALW